MHHHPATSAVAHPGGDMSCARGLLEIRDRLRADPAGATRCGAVKRDALAVGIPPLRVIASQDALRARSGTCMHYERASEMPPNRR
jgi:hypothetical protein